MTETLAQPTSPSTCWQQLAEGLARHPGPHRVVFAEGADPRVRRAVAELVPLGITPMLITPEMVADLAGGAAGRILTDAQRSDPVFLAAALVRLGAADAAVAGCVAPSSDVIRAGLKVIGLEDGCATLSSSFLLHLPDGRTLAFGDCAVVPEPDAAQLADIAIATAGTFAAMTGEEPAVAMLSFSTLGSADHESVRRVREATALVRERAPGLAVDGEMQFDAALVASVAEQKAAGSVVAGHANVFIFPNLAAGNIGYKIAQRLGGAEAVGPILQGLRAPMNDLSRGCSADDVVGVGVVSALQAAARGRKPAWS